MDVRRIPRRHGSSVGTGRALGGPGARVLGLRALCRRNRLVYTEVESLEGGDKLLTYGCMQHQSRICAGRAVPAQC